MYKEGVCFFFKNKADTDWVSIFEYHALEIKLDNRPYYYASCHCRIILSGYMARRQITPNVSRAKSIKSNDAHLVCAK